MPSSCARPARAMPHSGARSERASPSVDTEMVRCGAGGGRGPRRGVLTVCELDKVARLVEPSDVEDAAAVPRLDVPERVAREEERVGRVGRHRDDSLVVPVARGLLPHDGALLDVPEDQHAVGRRREERLRALLEKEQAPDGALVDIALLHAGDAARHARARDTQRRRHNISHTTPAVEAPKGRTVAPPPQHINNTGAVKRCGPAASQVDQSTTHENAPPASSLSHAPRDVCLSPVRTQCAWRRRWGKRERA
eukprot:883871-Prymnesium_polylepis.2